MDMNWATLFERATDVDVSVSTVREAVTEQRNDD
jgi:hypothetical protein